MMQLVWGMRHLPSFSRYGGPMTTFVENVRYCVRNNILANPHPCSPLPAHAKFNLPLRENIGYDTITVMSSAVLLSSSPCESTRLHVPMHRFITAQGGDANQNAREVRETRNTRMNKLTTLLLVVGVIATLFMVTGCDPEKTGGGGLLQSYDSGTGRYN